MANPEHRPTDTTVQPAGVEGEGMDPYPTYRDGPSVPHRATTTKPTDTGLPRSRRTYALPIFIALVVFALIILARLIFASIEMARTTDEAMTPGDASSPPAATAPAIADTPAAPTELPEAGGAFDEDVQTETQTGPGDVEPTPAPIDVPGGAATTPVEPNPTR